MSTTISKSDIVKEVAENLGMTQNSVQPVIDEMLTSIMAHVADDHKVTLTGFGTWDRRSRKERQGVRPGTTEKITIPATDYPGFKAGKIFKEAVSGD